MAKRSESKSKSVSAPARSLMPARGNIAQRKCACGAAAGMSGECEECGKKQLMVPQRPADRNETSALPSKVNATDSAAGTHAAMDSRFGHDFGRIQLFGPAQRGAGEASKKKGAPKAAKKPAGTTSIGAPVRKTYPVSGATLAEAATEIEARDEAGLTEWNPKLDYKTDDQGVVTSATVVVDLTVTMPDWPGAAKLAKAARAEWDRFYGALQRHEQGHVDLAHKFLSGLGSSLVGKTEAEANAALNEAVQKLQEASDAYDVDTDHGRNRGTVMDTSIK